MIAVGTSPMTKLTAVTAASMTFIGSRSCASATCHTDGGFSPEIWFGPCSASRLAASPSPRPRSASLPTLARTAAGSSANQWSAPAGPGRRCSTRARSGVVAISVPPPSARCRQLEPGGVAGYDRSGLTADQCRGVLDRADRRQPAGLLDGRARGPHLRSLEPAANSVRPSASGLPRRIAACCGVPQSL
jgi:hypothetical protein